MMTMLAATRRSPLPWLSDGPRAIPQAFPYQGSKRALAGLILSLFPEEGVRELIEPFAGSAAVCVAARKYGMADDCFISDVNAPLIGLWRQILFSPEALSSRYEQMWLAQQTDARVYYARIRDEFNRTQAPEMLLYLLCRCVKAAIRYNQKTGDFNQGADNRRLGARPDVVRGRIAEVSRLLQGSIVRVADYETVLAQASPNALIYMDPPYQGTTDVADHRYLSGLTPAKFAVSLADAVARDLSFIVSYDGVVDGRSYCRALPESLGLRHINVVTGASAQATLLGRDEQTVESLYLSPALVDRIGGDWRVNEVLEHVEHPELPLF